MSDTPLPSSTEKTVVIDGTQLRRLWTFTLVSISLNALIIAAFLIGAIIHHHEDKRHGFGGRGGMDGGRWCEMAGPRGGYGHGFHRFGGMGFRPMGGPGPMMGGGPGMMRGGPGMMDDDMEMNMHSGGGMRGMMRGDPGMDDMMGGDPGMKGMMGGPGTPPDPAILTDVLLDHLSTQLTLTDDQKAKVKPIIQNQVTAMQKDMESRRAAMQKSLEDTKAKLKPLLNADQQKELDAIPLPGQKPAAAAPVPAK